MAYWLSDDDHGELKVALWSARDEMKSIERQSSIPGEAEYYTFQADYFQRQLDRLDQLERVRRPTRHTQPQ